MSNSSYSMTYYLDTGDVYFPRIGKLPQQPLGLQEPDENLMSFGAAKLALLEYIRSKRDHWAERLREAKALTADDVPMGS
jgi:hypothetical protein